MSKSAQYILWFSEINSNDSELVGKSGVVLSELKQNDFPIPNGFIITSSAYIQFLKENNLQLKIKHLLSNIVRSRPESIHQTSLLIKRLILNSDLSEELVKESFTAYKKLNGSFKNRVVKMQSQIMTENTHHDLLGEQHGLMFEVHGETNLLVKLKESWAEVFSAKRLAYRHENNINHFSALSCMLVQQNVHEQKSGFIYTADPKSEDKSKIVISAILGNNKLLAQKGINPDVYQIVKKDMLINRKNINMQSKLILKLETKEKEILVPKELQNSQKITDKEILTLAHLGKKLEQYMYFPQQCEWVIADNKIYLLRFSPLSPVITQATGEKTITKGQPVFPGLATGSVHKILTDQDYKEIKPGDIVAFSKVSISDKSFYKKVNGIICLQNSLTKQDIANLRSINIPTIAVDENVFNLLKNEQILSINGTKGEFYNGGLPKQTKTVATATNGENKTATKLFVSLNNLDQIDTVAKKANDGVGLLTAETVFQQIGKHPKSYIHEKKPKEYIGLLAEQFEKVLKAFTPRPVLYMIGDIKTDSYKKLTHGKSFEVSETNPLLGYHGTFRAIHDPHVLKMEIEAVKMVRNKMNLRNIWVMLPFVRSVHELSQLKKLMSSEGLHRSPTFKVWLSISLPANLVILDKYLELGVDGVSLDIEELTMLTLGLDINNDETIRAFDFEDEAMLKIFETAIKTVGKKNIPVSIHNRSKLLSKTLTEYFISWGASALTIQPQSLNATKEVVLEVEKKLISGLKK